MPQKSDTAPWWKRRQSEDEAWLGPEGGQGRRGGVEQGACAEGVAGAHVEGGPGSPAPALDADEAAALAKLAQEGFRSHLDGPVDHVLVNLSIAMSRQHQDRA